MAGRWRAQFQDEAGEAGPPREETFDAADRASAARIAAARSRPGERLVSVEHEGSPFPVSSSELGHLDDPNRAG